MNLLSILEKCANTVHHQFSIDNLLFENKLHALENIFKNNDGASLRSQLGNTNNLADRDRVVSVNLK